MQLSPFFLQNWQYYNGDALYFVKQIIFSKTYVYIVPTRYVNLSINYCSKVMKFQTGNKIKGILLNYWYKFFQQHIPLIVFSLPNGDVFV